MIFMNYALNVKGWKFTLISKWLLFNSNQVGFSSKRVEKTYSWSLAIPSQSHSCVEWLKFHSFAGGTISQSEAPKIAWYLAGLVQQDGRQCVDEWWKESGFDEEIVSTLNVKYIYVHCRS